MLETLPCSFSHLLCSDILWHWPVHGSYLPQKFSGYSASIPWGQSSLMALLRPQWPRLSGWQAREVISSRSGARSSRPKTLTQFKTPTLLDPFSRSWRSLWDQDLCWDGVWIGRYHCTLCP